MIKKRNKRRNTNWKRVDWTLSNNEIAAKYGVSYQAVHAQRLKRTNYQPRKNQKIDWSLVSPDMAIDEIVGILKVERTVAYRYLFQHGYRVRPSKDDWLAVDWSKKNIEIAKELSVSKTAVAFQRSKHEKNIGK